MRKIVRKTEKIKLKVNRAVDSVKKAEDTVISGTYSVAGMDQNESLVKAAATATKLVNTYKVLSTVPYT